MSDNFERIMNWSGKSVGYYSTIAPKGLYRPEGPVLIYSNGLMLWGYNDHLNHRSDGPSRVDLKKGERIYYLNNVQMSKEQFQMWYEIAYLKEYHEPNDCKWFYQEFDCIE